LSATSNKSIVQEKTASNSFKVHHPLSLAESSQPQFLYVHLELFPLEAFPFPQEVQGTVCEKKVI